MVDNDWAINRLSKLVSVEKLVHKSKPWAGSRFEDIKLAPATEKGNLGEMFLKDLLTFSGFPNVIMPESRRGHYYVELSASGGKITFEVKATTQDINGSFQFNGIRYDRNFTHLFCLGVMPDNVKFTIIPMSEFHDHTLVSMAKGSNATFKLTRKENTLLDFVCFQQSVDELWPNGRQR